MCIELSEWRQQYLTTISLSTSYEIPFHLSTYWYIYLSACGCQQCMSILIRTQQFTDGGHCLSLHVPAQFPQVVRVLNSGSLNWRDTHIPIIYSDSLVSLVVMKLYVCNQLGGAGLD